MHDSHIWLSITKCNRIINSSGPLENRHVMKLDHCESYLWFYNKRKPTYDSWFFLLATQHNKMDGRRCTTLRRRLWEAERIAVEILTGIIPSHKEREKCVTAWPKILMSKATLNVSTFILFLFWIISLLKGKLLNKNRALFKWTTQIFLIKMLLMCPY